MNKILCLLFLILFSVNAKSQGLELNEVLNKAYAKVSLDSDTLNYIISECAPFIQVQPKPGEKIKIKLFKTKEHLISQLSEADSYLLKVSISEVAEKSLKLIFSIYKVNNNVLNGANDFLIFYDQRTIECELNDKNKWVYKRTVDVKRHLTD